MNYSEDVTRLKAEVEAGHVDVFIPYADELAMSGHVHGDELMELAIDIRDEPDQMIVVMSIMNFEELVLDVEGKAKRK